MKHQGSERKKGINLLALFGIIVIVVALAIILPICFSNDETAEKLETYTVSYGNITHSVSGDGTVEQANISIISPDFSAKIIAANYRQGDVVEAGDVIYEFDTSAIDLEIEKAQLTYDQAKIAYDNSSGTDRKINEIDMKSAELELNNSKAKLSDYKVVAPISGVIIKAEYSLGDFYDGSTANELVVIAEQKTFEVNFIVDESYITQIACEQTATISIKSAIPNNYTGVVKGYDLMGTTGNGVTTYNVCVTFDAPEDAKLLNGMSANVSVVLAEKEKVLLIPSSAIDKDGNVTILTENQEYKTVSVELGVCDDKYVEILSGIKEGDIILTNP